MTEIPPIKKAHRLTVPSKDNTHKATRNKVLDHKTISILSKLQKRRILSELDGCISSGKEAEIYKGKITGDLQCSFLRKGKKDKVNLDELTETENISSDDEKCSTNEENLDKLVVKDEQNKDSEEKQENKEINVVLKIFRTSTIQFKNRAIYFSSEKRYPEYRKSSSRQMIKRWAEKEVRNLTRLYKCGIKTARPIYLKRNIIIMEMIGTENNIGIRLKEILSVQPSDLPSNTSSQFLTHFADKNELFFLENVYLQVLDLIYDMYNVANIIHCDLSEYNLLWFDGTVYVIDVGQSVDTTHNYSDIFLMNDILNINRFFEKMNVEIVHHKGIYETVTKKEMKFELNGTEINKFGFEIDQEILLREKLDNFDVSKKSAQQIDKKITAEDSQEFKSDEEYISCSDDSDEFTTTSDKDVKKNQFMKNKFLTKEEKLERRKAFKHERKMKRMCRNKSTTAKKATFKKRKP